MEGRRVLVAGGGHLVSHLVFSAKRKTKHQPSLENVEDLAAL